MDEATQKLNKAAKPADKTKSQVAEEERQGDASWQQAQERDAVYGSRKDQIEAARIDEQIEAAQEREALSDGKDRDSISQKESLTSDPNTEGAPNKNIKNDSIQVEGWKDTDTSEDIERRMPEDLAAKYITVKNTVYYAQNTSQPAFTDQGKKLSTERNSKTLAVDFVKIAHQRGWENLHVSGSDEFKSAIWLESQKKGIEVKGYEPKEHDLAAAQKLLRDQEEAKDKARVFLKEDKETAIAKYPDLIKSYALVSAVAKFSAKSIPKDADKFNAMIKDGIASKLEKMESIPKVNAYLPKQEFAKEHTSARDDAMKRRPVTVQRNEDQELQR